MKTIKYMSNEYEVITEFAHENELTCTVIVKAVKYESGLFSVLFVHYNYWKEGSGLDGRAEIDVRLAYIDKYDIEKMMNVMRRVDSNE
jgi:hypothetical protein